ncbi:MAG TPA: GxxExxY protein [bacterium]|nr:GxxExxY protein [bacterium]
MELKHQEITEKIIECFYKVYNKLGYGFIEKVYENAMIIELERIGLKVKYQPRLFVYYDNGEQIGDFNADLLVEESVIVELKAKKKIIDDFEAQLLNYLNSSIYEVGLLLNFGIKPELKRKIYDNDLKKWYKKISVNQSNP